MDTEPDTPEEKSVREFYEETAHYQLKMYDASVTYNQVVVLAGYAAFFAVWSAVADEIPPWVMLLSGGLILCSVVFYVGWTVANMILLKTANERILGQITGGPIGFHERAMAAELQNIAASRKIMKYWKPVLVSAGTSGFIGAVLLASAAIANAVGRLT